MRLLTASATEMSWTDETCAGHGCMRRQHMHDASNALKLSYLTFCPEWSFSLRNANNMAGASRLDVGNHGAGRASVTRLSCRRVGICWHEGSLQGHQFEEIFLCTEYVICNTRSEFSFWSQVLSSIPQRSPGLFQYPLHIGVRCSAGYGVVSSGLSGKLDQFLLVFKHLISIRPRAVPQCRPIPIALSRVLQRDIGKGHLSR